MFSPTVFMVRWLSACLHLVPAQPGREGLGSPSVGELPASSSRLEAIIRLVSPAPSNHHPLARPARFIMAEQPHLPIAAASQAQQQRLRRPAPPARTSTLFSSSSRRDTTTTYPPPLSYFFPPPKGAFLFGTPAVGHFGDDDEGDEAAIDAQAHDHLAAISHLEHTRQHETHRDAFGMASFFPSPSPSSGWGWLVHAHAGRESDDDEVSDESDDDDRSSSSSSLGGGGAREECASWISSPRKDTTIKDPHRRPSVASGLGASVAFALPSGPDGKLEVVTPGDHDDPGGVRFNSTYGELDSAANSLLAWWTANTKSGAPEEGARVDGDGGAVSSPVWETSFGWTEEGEQQRSRGNEEEQTGLEVNQTMGIEEGEFAPVCLGAKQALD